MIRTVRATLASIILSVLVFTTLYHPQIEQQVEKEKEEDKSIVYSASVETNCAINDDHRFQKIGFSLLPVSILFPAWEVLLIFPSDERLLPDSGDIREFLCLYPNNDSSQAIHVRILDSPERILLRCNLPAGSRRRQPFPQPRLVKSQGDNNSPFGFPSPASGMLRWNYLVYESLSTEHDVVLFVKGINNRQGVNRSPTEFRCLFMYGNGSTRVRTVVTVSSQEVFRCRRPNFPTYTMDLVKVTLEIVKTNQLVPSVAYYIPVNKVASKEITKSLICACTMVYNVTKFLREWMSYYSAIGVEKFIFYDNGSDDGFEDMVKRLGYKTEIRFWIWQKTQEAAFSHCAIQFKDSCEWMIFVDVDEFIFSPIWINSSTPLNNMLSSLLLKTSISSVIGSNIKNREIVGQVTISCYEFGPSNQTDNPSAGVTQGYDCRRRTENRHKSIVLLDAIDDSLLNAVHHFKLREGFVRRKVSLREAAVNHYKYQAWPEFRTKFRRRASAYVTDWTQSVNPLSKDRTPGLGFSPVEPEGWSQKFCEVHDDRLRNLTRRWFGL